MHRIEKRMHRSDLECQKQRHKEKNLIMYQFALETTADGRSHDVYPPSL